MGKDARASAGQEPGPAADGGRRSGGGKASVLVVEDAFLVALDVAGVLQELGYAVVGPAASGADALALLDRERPDAALLDAGLPGGDGGAEAVAAALAAAGVPFAVLTGHDPGGIAGPALRGAPYLAKPYRREDLRATLALLAAAARRPSPQAA